MLNDDVMDDMENTVVDHDLIKGPSQVQTSTNVVIIPGKPEEETTNSEIINQLSQAEIQFQVIDKHTTKLVDMQAVYDEISTEGAISKSDVAYALEEFPNLLTGRLTLEQFSQSRSKVNYDKLVSTMRVNIATEESLLFENSKTFFKDPLNGVMLAMGVVLQDHLPVVNNTGNDIFINAKDILSKLEGSKNTIVKYKEEFKSFLDIPIRELQPSMFINNTIDVDAFNKSVTNIETAYDCRAIKVCIAVVIYGKDLGDVFASENMRNETIQDITLKDLLSFYSNDKFPELLASLETIVKEAITKLEFIKNSSNVETCTPAELHSYLVQNNVAFMNAIRNCMTIASGVFSLGQLNFNTGILFQELKKA